MATVTAHEGLVGGAVSHAPPGRAGFLGAVRSEFTKIRSVRSTYWTLIALVIVCVGIGALFSWGQTERIIASRSGTTLRGHRYRRPRSEVLASASTRSGRRAAASACSGC